MKNITVIGAGNIGARHLQSINKLNYNLTIYVVDPKISFLQDSLNNSLEKNENQSLIFLKDLSSLPRNLDLVIIATNSDVRRNIIVTLIQKRRITYLILEKIVFQNPNYFLEVRDLLLKNNVKTWVNTPMRFYPFYKILKNRISKDLISMTSFGNGWNLASNSIHIIDSFCFLIDESNIIIDTSGLHQKLYKSKRRGFKELKGEIKVKSSNGSSLLLKDSNSYNYFQKIKIKFSDMKYVIDIENNIIFEQKIGRKLKKTTYKFPYQSELTSKYVKQLIASRTLDLPSFEESMKTHIELLKSFNKCLFKDSDPMITIAPFT